MTVSYLDPAAVARLANLTLAARTVVEGFISGLHRSPLRGFSLEFAQHRAYVPGDELRHIDWKVYGRTDRYVVRQFEEETNMRCLVAIDVSASMNYKHDGDITKLQYACYCAASLAYLMLKQQDSFGIVTFDREIRRMLPPRASTGHLTHVLDLLGSIVPAQAPGIVGSLTELGKRLHKRHLIIICSDLMDNPDEILRALRYFHFKKHEVIVFHILDPAELSFPFQGPVRFEGLEQDDVIITEPAMIRSSYQRLMRQLIARYRGEFTNAGIEYALTETAQPFDIMLGNYLSKRAMIR